jgi:hypothetical protein
MFMERKQSGLQNENMFNMKLTAVTHDNKLLGKCERKGGVKKTETFSKTCVSIMQQ